MRRATRAKAPIRPAAACAPLAFLLLVPLLLPAAAAQAPPPEERPIAIALQELPGALASAIAEAEDRLLADVAQRRLEDTYAYVQGFQSLPDGHGALQDPGLRAAYAWTGDVVQSFLAFPATFAGTESADATCRVDDGSLGAPAAARVVEQGLGGVRTLRAVRAALHELAASPPARVDATPVLRSLDLLDAWLADDGQEVEACLVEFAARYGVATTFLQAVLVPDATHRTGRVRLFGSVGGAGSVTVSAPGLAWTATLPADGGAFQHAHTVPRGAALGNHAVRVEGGGRSATLTLTVHLAAVDLALDAPARVAVGEAFHATVRVRSAAGTAEADLVPVALDWNGTATALPLTGGSATATLVAPAGPGRLELHARFPGSDVLAPAAAQRTIDVVEPASVQAAPQEPGEPLRTIEELAGRLHVPPWVLLAAALLALAAVGFAAVALRPPMRASLARPPPPAPAFAGASSFTGAMGLLFAALRRLRLVPPGRTVREWVRGNGLALDVAERFEQVRYGHAPEGRALAFHGVSWVRRMWQRWVR